MYGRTIVWLLAFLLVLTGLLSAQEGGDAPQILTSDLAKQTPVEENTLTVVFTIVDTDDVVKVTIDGKPQEITPSDTVQVKKNFRFKPGITRITVIAEDEKGNKRTRSYRVAYKAKDSEAEEDKPAQEGEKAKGMTFNVIAELTQEVDTNPTQDLSLPSSVASSIDLKLEGQVPDDEQTDVRTGAGLILSAGLNGLGLFGGIFQSEYAKTANAGLSSTVAFLGGQYRFDGEGKPGWQLTSAYTGVTLKSGSSTILSLSPGYEVQEAVEDGKTVKVYLLDVQMKGYSATDKESVTAYALKRQYSFTDKAGQDTSKSTMALGQTSDGTFTSEQQYFSYDAGWKIQWDSGFMLTPEWGFEYRNYPNDKDILLQDLGKTRLDIPLRFAFGIGQQFLKSFTAMLKYQYLVDISNDSPYERQTYGLVLTGTF